METVFFCVFSHSKVDRTFEMEDDELRFRRVHSGYLVDISESNNHKISLQFIPRPILHLLILS